MIQLVTGLGGAAGRMFAPRLGGTGLNPGPRPTKVFQSSGVVCNHFLIFLSLDIIPFRYCGLDLGSDCFSSWPSLHTFNFFFLM